MRTLKKTSSPFFRFTTVGVIILLCFLFFWKTFLKGEIPFPGDFVVGIYHPWLDYKWGSIAGIPVKNPITADVPSFMYPMQTFAASLLKSGQWPLWNPHILGGAPLLANFQSAPFSPLMLFSFLFSDPVSWTAQVITAHILAVFFTFLLLREWKVSRMGAITGGIIFSFSGFNLIWSQWNGHVLTAACFPLIIYFLDRFLNKGGIKNCVGLSVALALQIVAGYPQLVLYTALVMGIVFLCRFSLKKVPIIVLFTIFGFTLAAAQLLPGKELLSQSQWMSEPHPMEWAFLPFEKTITFIAPDYFGNHVTKNYWGKQDYTSNTGFVGIVAIVLSGAAFLFDKRRKQIQIAALIVLAALILSYKTPLSEFLWTNNILGMRSSSAHRAMVLFNLGIALLAGFGVDYIKQKSLSWREYFRLFSPSLFLITVFAAIAWQINNRVALRNLIFPCGVIFILMAILFLCKKLSQYKTLFLVCISALLILEIYRFGWKFTPFSSVDFVFPHTPITQFLANQQKPYRISNGDTMPVNFQMAYGLETIGGYETMRPLHSSQFIASLNNNNPRANPAGRYGILDNDTSHLLAMANTKYYLTLKKDKKGAPSPDGVIPAKFDHKRFKLAFEDKSTAIMESLDVLPRAKMFFDWQIEASSEQTLEKLLNPEFAFSEKILLEESPSISLSKPGNSKVEFSIYTPQKNVINISTDNSGMLFISDAWYPGWHAFVDGAKAKIYKANYMFRAVEMPAGNHIVEFRYEPESFQMGLKISIISFLALAAIMAYTSLIRR